MKYLSSLRFTLSMLLLGAMFPVAAEDLDAALNARKKKAKRRVYSERAIIDNRDIVIPKTQSEEERILDRDLKRLESQLDSAIAPPRIRVPRRMPSPSSRKSKNWLTPSLLNAENCDGLSPEKNEPSWIDQELDRQKEIQFQKRTLAEEEALVNKMLREDSRQKISIESRPVKPYQPMLRNSLFPTDPNPASTYNSFSPSTVILPKKKLSPSRMAPVFSPAARANSGVIKSAFSAPSTSQKPDWSPQFGSSTPPKSTSDFRSDWTVSKPLPPLKRVRKASAINKKNPFDDNDIPDIKTSIWD